MPAMAALWVIMTAVVPSCFVGALDGGENNLAGFIVESTGRLVTKQHVGRLGDGARDRDPLLLATGQLGRKMIKPFLKSDQRERLARVERMLRLFRRLALHSRMR